jgi:hypothetical protein
MSNRLVPDEMVKSAGGLAARPSNNYSRGDTARSINMPVTTQRITPFLWFDNQAEEAVAFYTSIFKNSKVLTTASGSPP